MFVLCYSIVRVGDDMKSQLIHEDIHKFLEKYTRYMTKDIYITKKMDNDFLNHYQYLIQELKKNQYLYQDQLEYKKVFSILKNHNKVLKLHNQKYLDKRSSLPMDHLIMGMDSMLVVMKKNVDDFLIRKIQYLEDNFKKYKNKIGVLIDSEENYYSFMDKISSSSFKLSFCQVTSSYYKSFMKEGERYLDLDTLYQWIFEIITDKIYGDKKKFHSFYQAFGDFIYLNKDYLNFDTFHDYHEYIYQRKFMESGLSLKKYIEKEIKLRRKSLRSIDNELMNTKEEVDVANFLFLNSISYRYDKEESCFICHRFNVKCKIQFIDSTDKNTISLNRNSKYLDVLVYELIKRQYSMERVSDEEVFRVFKNHDISNYFCDLIRNVLIPAIIYYEKYHQFDDTSFSVVQKKWLKSIYEVYLYFLKERKYVSSSELYLRCLHNLNDGDLEYIILWGDGVYSLSKEYLQVIDEYPNEEIFQGNKELTMEYYSYLKENKQLVGEDNYLNFQELSLLTGSFLKKNIKELNKNIIHSEKKIDVCFYREENRLSLFRNITGFVYDILRKEDKNFSLSLMLSSDSDKKMFFGDGIFCKKNSYTISCDIRDIFCYSYLSIRDVYDIVIVPTLFYHSCYDNLLNGEDMLRIKMYLLMALNHAKRKVYLFCPQSKKSQYLSLFQKLGNVNFFEKDLI